VVGEKTVNTGARLTIRDIAARSGVSIATVSRVLNGRPDVSPTTREAVLATIRENGYATNRSARGLAGGRTGLIGLTLPYLHSDYFARIVGGAAEALYERDARFVLCPTRHEHDREVSLLERVMHGTTDGGFLLLPSESSEELSQLSAEGYPFVVVDPMVPIAEDIPVVTAAHWSGARAAVEHLIELGHRRIAAVTGYSEWVATRDRLASYQSTIMGAGLRYDDNYVVEAAFTVESGYEAGIALLSLSDPPTAVFAFNDNMALGVMQAARDCELVIGHDLSIVGFDDLEIAEVSAPGLTTVRQPLEEMGRIAASLLWRLLDGRPLDATRVELSTRLVVRESTGHPPDRSLRRGA
jgi:LacI family transcriptional regulator